MSDKPKYYAILPAAGKSKRMGQPKLLLPWPNEDRDIPSPHSDVSGIATSRVIDQVLHTWTCSRVDEVVVIVRNDDQELRDACSRWKVCIVQPASDPLDMKESVQNGLRYLQKYRPNRIDRFFVAPADTPTISTAMINRLADVTTDQDTIIVPSFAGRPGHPVLLPWVLSQEIFDLGENEGVDQVVSRHPQMMVEFDADERVGDVDTPDEYQAAFQLAQKRRSNQR
jgi:molybdenum cofactor cytidylyltransferase